MSTTEANLETIRSIYAAFGQGDVTAILACLDQDVEWEPGYEHNRDIPWLQSGRGHAQASQFFEALRAFDLERFEVVALMGSGPWVVALTAVELVHRASGRVLKEDCEPHVWKLDDAGKVVSMRHAADTRQHARVAGLAG